MNKDVKAIVLFVPPGSGKTTQAVLLEEKLGWEYVSWGRISRKILNGKIGGAEDRVVVERNIVSDFRFPDGFIKGFMVKELKEKMLAGHTKFIIDGFPKHPQEMKDFISMLKELKITLHATISIACSKPVVMKRVKERIYCEDCGRFYNNIIKPTSAGVCDFDGRKLLRRIDDTEALVGERYSEYVDEQSTMVKMLKDYSTLFFSLNGDVDELLLFSELVTKLNRGHRDMFKLYRRECQAKIPTKFGFFDIFVYQNTVNFEVQIALVCGDLNGKKAAPVRIHSSCITGDIFHSEKCDCGGQLDASLKLIQANGFGAVIYLFQEGRGINIINKIKAYSLQEKGVDAVDANEFIGLPAEMRQYDAVRDVLEDLNVKSISLITNNPDKINKLLDLGIIVDGSISAEAEASVFSKEYLKTKVARMSHYSSSSQGSAIPQVGRLIEVEMKFLATKESAVKLLQEVFEMFGTKGDLYYEKNVNYDKDKSLEKTDSRLRVRTKLNESSGEKSFEVTLKKRLGFVDGVKKEKETTLDISKMDGSVDDLFVDLGYEERDSYERMRRIIFGGGLKITFDEFPFGSVIEIEGEETGVRDLSSVLFPGIQAASLSCDEVYEMLCVNKNITPKKHILFSDKHMPSLDDYLKTNAK